MPEMVEKVVDLPAVKRYIASHDANGKSVYVDSPPQQYFGVPGVGGLARSYSVATVPSKLGDDDDLKAYLSKEGVTSWTTPSIVTPNGANLLVVDLAPGGVSAMHRTVSIDFSICVLGEIDREFPTSIRLYCVDTNGLLSVADLLERVDELDGGDKVRLRPGDHIVQRGTMHKWHNASKTQPARFIATTISCVPFDIAGKQLEEVHIPHQPQEKL
ncbi:hypothetical protein H2200_001786 [Cladophialophora chaetospira]|uniref:Uncharacterized protein n=1 Tax=Cladophialophora chaetospira TaxID=386627 RepID=A0AA38XLK1_9EURO|nr:hypothetical protein H2200_001786 [Cladophialophora chaetospira]